MIKIKIFGFGVAVLIVLVSMTAAIGAVDNVTRKHYETLEKDAFEQQETSLDQPADVEWETYTEYDSELDESVHQTLDVDDIITEYKTTTESGIEKTVMVKKDSRVCVKWNMTFSGEKYELQKMLFQDDDVEVLWKNSEDIGRSDGTSIFSSYINDDDIPDVLANRSALDGSNGELIWNTEVNEEDHDVLPITDGNKICDVGDINNDGSCDIGVTTNIDGCKICGVGDINNDGRDEIFAKVEEIGEYPYLYSMLYCLDGADGTIIWKAYLICAWIFGPIAVGDLLGDNQNEIIVPTGDWFERGNHRVYCLDGSTGIKIWRRYMGKDKPAVAAKIEDVNADGKNDVIVSDWVGRVYCLKGINGRSIWERDPIGDVRTLCIGDLNSDPYKEIIIEKMADEFGVRCLSGKDGRVLWSWEQDWDAGFKGSFQSMIIADMIPDIPGNEVVAGGVCGIYCLYGGDTAPSDGREIWHAGIANGVLPGIVMSAAVGDLDDDGFLDVVGITDQFFYSEKNVYALNGRYGSRLWNYEDCGGTDFYAIICSDLTEDGTPEVIAKDDSYVCALINSFPSENNPPNKPTIDGPTWCKIGEPYDFSALTNDSDNDVLYYYFEWGDGTGSISQAGESGENVYVSNIWNAKGNYTIRAKAIDEHGADGDWSESIVINVPGEPPIVEITKPENALYINNEEIMPTPSPIIVGSIDIEVDVTDEVYDVERVEFYVDGIIRQVDYTAPFSWTWDEKTSIIKHTINIVAFNNVGIQGYEEIKVRKLGGTSQLDQHQTEFDGKYGLVGTFYINIPPFPIKIHYSSAQSFIPTKRFLTKVCLYIANAGASTKYTLAIRKSLDGENLASTNLSVDEFPEYGKYGWLEFEFDEVQLTPGRSYYIVCFTEEMDAWNLYSCGGYGSNVYKKGFAFGHNSISNKWSLRTGFDMCFMTLGRNTPLSTENSNQISDESINQMEKDEMTSSSATSTSTRMNLLH